MHVSRQLSTQMSPSIEERGWLQAVADSGRQFGGAKNADNNMTKKSARLDCDSSCVVVWLPNWRSSRL